MCLHRSDQKREMDRERFYVIEVGMESIPSGIECVHCVL
jgi:hypothetical protein